MWKTCEILQIPTEKKSAYPTRSIRFKYFRIPNRSCESNIFPSFPLPQILLSNSTVIRNKAIRKKTGNLSDFVIIYLFENFISVIIRVWVSRCLKAREYHLNVKGFVWIPVTIITVFMLSIPGFYIIIFIHFPQHKGALLRQKQFSSAPNTRKHSKQFISHIFSIPNTKSIWE